MTTQEYEGEYYDSDSPKFVSYVCVIQIATGWISLQISDGPVSSFAPWDTYPIDTLAFLSVSEAGLWGQWVPECRRATLHRLYDKLKTGMAADVDVDTFEHLYRNFEAVYDRYEQARDMIPSLRELGTIPYTKSPVGDVTTRISNGFGGYAKLLVKLKDGRFFRLFIDEEDEDDVDDEYSGVFYRLTIGSVTLRKSRVDWLNDWCIVRELQNVGKFRFVWGFINQPRYIMTSLGCIASNEEKILQLLHDELGVDATQSPEKDEALDDVVESFGVNPKHLYGGGVLLEGVPDGEYDELGALFYPQAFSKWPAWVADMIATDPVTQSFYRPFLDMVRPSRYEWLSLMYRARERR